MAKKKTQEPATLEQAVAPAPAEKAEVLTAQAPAAEVAAQ
jgi:hypothetical protein